MTELKRFLAIVAVCLAAACTGESGPSVGEEMEVVAEPVVFEEIDWRLERYRDEAGEMNSVLTETAIEARFSAGQLAGNAGCNRYFGSYAIDEVNQLSIGPEIGSTQMACPPPVTEQEWRYLALLPQVATVARTTDALQLLGADGVTLLEFTVEVAATLEGTEWQATGINNGQGGVATTATTSASTAVFSAGTVSGNAGCNQFHAAYELDGERLTIGPAMATKMMCAEPEGIMDQEQQYLEALGRAHTVSITADRLELRDADGALQVSFHSAE